MSTESRIKFRHWEGKSGVPPHVQVEALHSLLAGHPAGLSKGDIRGALGLRPADVNILVHHESQQGNLRMVNDPDPLVTTKWVTTRAVTRAAGRTAGDLNAWLDEREEWETKKQETKEQVLGVVGVTWAFGFTLYLLAHWWLGALVFIGALWAWGKWGKHLRP